MFNFEAQLAREKILNSNEVSLKWNEKDQLFYPNKPIDRHILELIQEKRKVYNLIEIDELLKRLSEHDLGLETIGYDEL